MRASETTLTTAILALAPLAITALAISALWAGCSPGAGHDAGPARDARIADAGRTDAARTDAARVDAARRDAGGRADAGASPTCDASASTIRAIFIGNSQVAFWDLPQLVGRLSASAPAGCARVEGTAFTRGGANLGALLTDGAEDGRRLEAELSSGRYDAVVIAESIDLAEIPGFEAQFRRDATAIVELARAHGLRALLYASPYVERPDRSGFHAMADPQLALGGELGVPVAAGGLAWLRVWDEEPSMDLYYRDRAHPGYRGSYVSALVILAALTGASPIGLSAEHGIFCFDERTTCPAFAPGEAELFQRAALAQHLATGTR
ncbi:MAG: hypothetical protein AB7S26_13430 [Sandaracinaceae bacterium]